LHPCSRENDGRPFNVSNLQNEEEHPGRDQWYIARFVADDAPDWNVGSYLRTEAAGPSYRTVVVEAEISREKVPLRNCYKHVGQRASVRVNSGANRELTGGWNRVSICTPARQLCG
jgi:hypothetical protein